MMQRDVGEKAAGAGQSRRRETGEGRYRVLRRRETGEDQVEPDNVRFDLPDDIDEAYGSGEAAEVPAADDIKAG